jgi:hypothetical protein
MRGRGNDAAQFAGDVVSALCAEGFEPQARRYNDFSERGCPQPQRVETIRPLKVRASGSNFACSGWGHPRSVPDSGRFVLKRPVLPQKGAKGAKILIFSLQPSAFSLRFAALAIPAFLPNSHLPSAISQ